MPDEATPQLGVVARDFAGSMAAALNSHSVADVVALFHNDAVWVSPAAPQPVVGSRAIAEWIDGFFTTLPDVQCELLDAPFLSTTSAEVVLIWQMTGTMLGPGPGGASATGERVIYEEVDLVAFAGNRATRLTIHVDMLSLGRQLGIIPAVVP